MRKVSRYIDENRTIFSTIYHLAWPAILEQILMTVVQYTDSAMVGRIGAHASAAVGLTATMTWLVNSPLFAMGIGVLSCIAESMGAGRKERARAYGVQSLYFILILGTVLGALMLGISPHLPAWLGADPAIRREASMYFAIICAPMVFRAMSVILGSVLRGAGDTKSPMFANIIMNLTNLVLNFFLIYESRYVQIGGLRFFLPSAALATNGAALATAIAYVVGGIFMFAAYWRNPDLCPKGCSVKPNRQLMQKCLSIGTPVAMERVSACLGQVYFTSLVTSLGTLALATHSIAITAEQAFYIPGYGMQSAASTMAGNALGEQNQKKFQKVAGIILTITIIMMTITGALLFCFPGFMMSIFTTDPEVIAGGITVLRIVAVSEPMFGAVIILEGVFNGIGDTKAPFFISLFSMWGVRILGTVFCLRVLHGALPIVWVCMIADNILRCILLTVRFGRGAWKRRFQ